MTFTGCYFYFEVFYKARSLLLFMGRDNIFPIFYGVSLPQITTVDLDFWKRQVRFFKICVQTKCRDRQLSWARGRNWTRIFFKLRKMPHFTKILGRLLGRLLTPYTPRVTAKMDFSYHGEMKYNFHRQLPLRFCVLANFSFQQMLQLYNSICPSAPSKIVNFRGATGGKLKNFIF